MPDYKTLNVACQDGFLEIFLKKFLDNLVLYIYYVGENGTKWDE
jgi:hypothetical protein